MNKAFILAGAALIALLAMSSSAAASQTTCSETLTGANVPGDLVVPEGGTCTISATTVGGDVKVGKGGYFEADASQISGDVTSNRGQTVFINTGSTVGGDVGVWRTAQVYLYNSTLNGRVQVWRSSQTVQVCGNQIDGRVELTNSGPDILFGDTLPGADCAGNTVKNAHSVNVSDNNTDNELVIVGNTIQGGDLRVNGNSGPSDKFVQNNVGGDALECFGNERPFTSSGNTGFATTEGQCAIPPTECNTTLSGQNVPGDLVVPEGGTCTISATTVGGDVKVGKGGYFEADASQISGDVTSNRGQTVFINTGSTVGGDVGVWRTAQVYLYNSTLNGRVQVWRSSQTVQVCGNQIDGRVELTNSGPDILFGDTLPGADCAGNTVKNAHSVNVSDNNTDNELVIVGNTIQGGDLRVNGNSGPSDKFVQNNVGGDALECFGNERPFTSSGNTGFATTEGQCAIPPTECNTTLSGQNVPGDLVVPEGGTCTISATTVGGDVKVGKGGYFEADASQISGDVTSNRGQTVFINTGSTVGGDVGVWRTAQVYLYNSTLNGRVQVWRSSQTVQVCGNQIDGRVELTNSGPDILFGDTLPGADCAGNTVKNAHSVNVSDNNTDNELVIVGNTIQGGDLRVNGNSGPSDKFVQNNVGGDALECFGNERPFTSSGNTGFATTDGQCT